MPDPLARGPHVLAIPTSSGGKVVLPFLTGDQADQVRQTFADLATPIDEEPEVWAGATKPCNNCDGKGGYNEQRETKTPSGGTVVVTVWAPCRPCKGNGTVPDRG